MSFSSSVLLSFLVCHFGTAGFLRILLVHVAATPYDCNASGCDAATFKPQLDCFGTTDGIAFVYTPAATGVAPSRHDYVHVGMFFQYAEYRFKLGCLGWTKRSAVEIEIDNGEFKIGFG